MNPDSFTLSELVKMAEGRGRLEWGQTSCLMALVANILRGPKKSKPVKPGDFNPYLQKAKPVMKITMAQLRGMIPDPLAISQDPIIFPFREMSAT